MLALPEGRHDSEWGHSLHHEYRGHRIRLIEAEPWSAELVELATGSTLPTKIVATPGESLHECWRRAHRLVDLYLDAPSATGRVVGPVRPWQVFSSPRQVRVG